MELSKIADILGIISCLFSVIIFITTHTILKNVQFQREEYESERYQLQTSLMALRDNVWLDHRLDIKIRSKIRTALYTYLQKYLPISSASCIFHLFRAIRISKKTKISEKKREQLCISLDFLIARFNKTEVENVGQD